MFEPFTVIAFTFGYLALLFAIAYLTENKARNGKSPVENPYVYTLSLAVYCSGWAYYGSVGKAATSGMEFLAVYIGPSLIAPLWWVVLRKIIRISKLKQISTLADFISARYGNDVNVGRLVTLICLFGVLPYLALQIKAIAISFDMLTKDTTASYLATHFFYQDTALYLALGLACFTVVFGTRNVQATVRHEGLVMAVAFESVFKLVAFLTVGVFVCFVVYDGIGDVFSKGAEAGLGHLYRFQPEGISEWFWLGILSMLAVMFLPRQFHVGVIENSDEKHLLKAMWLFPAYLLVFNFFVLPIAVGSRITLPFNLNDMDTLVLAFPLFFDQPWLAMLVYLGGFSAATSMMIVSVIAMSTMVTNSLVIPLLLRKGSVQKYPGLAVDRLVINIRRTSILLIFLLAYLYYHHMAVKLALVSIGLTSFVAIAQLAPAILGGIFWKAGSRNGAVWGMAVGFALWFFTLIIPNMIDSGYLPVAILEKGLLGIQALRPTALFGLENLGFISHGFFCSLFANTFIYVAVSLMSKQSSKEHNQAAVFVDIFTHSRRLNDAVIWRGKGNYADLKELLYRFLGREETEKAMGSFEAEYGSPQGSSGEVDPAFVNQMEHLLSGVVGTAAARIVVASATKEEEIRVEEVISILRETQELKRLNEELAASTSQLAITSRKLIEANEVLRLNDELKDDFISTVTHEMKTPITTIRAFCEILQDPMLEEKERDRFLKIIISETERMARLIDDVLDMERFDSNNLELSKTEASLKDLAEESFESMKGVFHERDLKAELIVQEDVPVALLDVDRIKQVVLNLLSNAAKFAKTKVLMEVSYKNGNFELAVSDDGLGIPEEEIRYIFDKFYQAKNHNSRKQKGSGLGLPISKHIVENHNGTINVDRQRGLTRFVVNIPLEARIQKDTET